MTWVNLTVLGLATARIALLLVVDEGPFMLFHRTRTRLGIRYDEYSNRVVEQPNPVLRQVAGVLNCTNCASLWIGGGLGLCFWLRRRATVLAALPLALSMAAMIFVRVSE